MEQRRHRGGACLPETELDAWLGALELERERDLVQSAVGLEHRRRQLLCRDHSRVRPDADLDYPEQASMQNSVRTAGDAKARQPAAWLHRDARPLNEAADLARRRAGNSIHADTALGSNRVPKPAEPETAVIVGNLEDTAFQTVRVRRASSSGFRPPHERILRARASIAHSSFGAPQTIFSPGFEGQEAVVQAVETEPEPAYADVLEARKLQELHDLVDAKLHRVLRVVPPERRCDPSVRAVDYKHAARSQHPTRVEQEANDLLGPQVLDDLPREDKIDLAVLNRVKVCERLLQPFDVRAEIGGALADVDADVAPNHALVVLPEPVEVPTSRTTAVEDRCSFCGETAQLVCAELMEQCAEVRHADTHARAYTVSAAQPTSRGAGWKSKVKTSLSKVEAIPPPKVRPGPRRLLLTKHPLDQAAG
jgi:hypothetical protein